MSNYAVINSLIAPYTNTTALTALNLSGIQTLTGAVRVNNGASGVVTAEVFPYTNLWDPQGTIVPPNPGFVYEDGTVSNAFKLPLASDYPGSLIIINSNRTSFYVKTGPNQPYLYHTIRSTVNESEGIYAIYVQVTDNFSVLANRSVLFFSNGHAWHNLNLTHYT